MSPSAPPVDDPSPPPEALPYEHALAELERLVSAMEGGQLPLEPCSTATSVVPSC
jgi:hypothetical protein